MSFAVSRLVIVVCFAFLTVSNSFSAEIRVVKNKYADFEEFYRAFAKEKNLEIHAISDALIKKYGVSVPPEMMLKVDDRAEDEYKGCEQLDFALDGEKVVSITGAFSPKQLGASESADVSSLREALKAIEGNDSDSGEECGATIWLDSDGGDLTTALEIGKIVKSKSRFAIVPDGARCISACLFVLLAARYENADTSISKAFAFSNSVIGVHWPNIDDDQVGISALQRLAIVRPQEAFKLFGEYWTRIGVGSIRTTGDAWFPLALLGSLELPAKQYFLVNSAAERKLAGINSIVLPSKFDQREVNIDTFRSACLTSLISPGARALLDVKDYEFMRNEVYVAYYPQGDSVCFANFADKILKVIVLPVGPIDTSGHYSKFRLSKTKVELEGLLKRNGIRPKLLGARYGIGKALSNLRQSDLRSFGAFLTSLNKEFDCVQCGNMRGRIIFAVGDENCVQSIDSEGTELKSNKEAQLYLKEVDKAGFTCDAQVKSLLMAHLVFEASANESGWPFYYANDEREYIGVPEFMDTKHFRISETCPSISGLCSAEVGQSN